MLSIQNITYLHPNRDLLFTNLNLSIQSHQKIAIVGNNGSGKSTLLKILAGELQATSGQIHFTYPPYYVPQHFGQFDDINLAEALKIDKKIKALKMIDSGLEVEKQLSVLQDDWNIEERTQKALSFWNLQDFNLETKMKNVSGGEKTKVLLAGIQIHNPELILLDEPTNHLDLDAREKLYEFIQSSNLSFIIVSHDRTLLELMNPIYELNKTSLTQYGGNYSFYKEQKALQENALYEQLHDRKVALKTAKKIESEAIERKNRIDARGKKKSMKEGIPKMLRKSMKSNAEKSSSKLKDTHSQKINTISDEVWQAKQNLPNLNKIKINFDNSQLHKGKFIAIADEINFGYSSENLWKVPLNFRISTGERICIKGGNGSGKTTLIKLLLGKIKPKTGELRLAEINSIYIDQNYSLIENDLTIMQQVEKYNDHKIPRHEIGIRLNRFLFDNDSWIKSCNVLSGGEKLRLILCCMMISNNSPDLFILDEPTNNLDLENIQILTNAINNYQGTLIVISHDRYFLQEIGIEREIELY